MVFGMLMAVEWDLPRPSFNWHGDVRILIGALVAGTITGVVVGSLVRRAFSWEVSKRRQLVRLTAPLAIVALLILGEIARVRVVYRVAQVAKHDEWAMYNVPRTTATIVPGSFPRWEIAQHHAKMRKKWAYFAARPWLAVEPDPPEPIVGRRRRRHPVVRPSAPSSSFTGSQ